MDADRCKDCSGSFRDADGRPAAGSGRAQGDHGLHAGRTARATDRVAIGVELFVVEMAVGVDHRIPCFAQGSIPQHVGFGV